MMDFIKEIHEARMVRTSGDQKELTYTDCCERLFIMTCMIEVMRYDADNENFMKSYLYKTLDNNQYSRFKFDKTDLYNFIYFANGDSKAMDKLKDPGAAKKLRRDTHLPLAQLNAYLTKVYHNPTSYRSTDNFFYALQKSLSQYVGQYAEMRRLLSNYTTIGTEQRKQIITKLLFAARAKLRSSDLIEEFSTWAGRNNLEVSSVADNEPTHSRADFDANNTKDATYYRLLVGNQKMMMAFKFVERAFKGGAMPLNYIQSYMPIIEMIHDFVQAGPQAIQQLKVLHARIKKSKKK
jgi:hypothetical protein